MRALIPLTLAAATACAPDFVPYNQLDRLRVLALRAEPMQVGFGASSTLTPLTHVPSGEAPAYRWSWCPFTTGSADGYTCAVTEAELQQAADASLPVGTTFDVPSFELGNEETAIFVNPFPPELLRNACAGLIGEGGAPAGAVPDCRRSFPITVRLDLSTATEALTAVRRIDLVVEGILSPNQNPQLAGLRAAGDGVDFDAAPSVAEDGSTPIDREADVELFVELDEAEAEAFVAEDGESAREQLVLTWFVEAGETEVTRTAFVSGRIGLDDARRNRWTTPARAELARDPARLVVVIRDDRGGVGWVDRTVTLVTP
jgi:hypothetical protein